MHLSDLRRRCHPKSDRLLGCLLQFMATGKPPFQGERVSQILQSVTTKAATKITRPPPPWFRHVLCKLLQKDPNLGPAEASIALADLDQDSLPLSSHFPSRRTWTLLLGGIALIAALLTLTRLPDRIPQDTPVYIEGESTRYENLTSAIAATPAGATIILRDGLHEVPRELIVHQALRLVAAKGAHPLLRSRDTERQGLRF